VCVCWERWGRGVQIIFGGGGEGVLQVDTFTAGRYFPHQINQHASKVQAPA
jgi:hypothetical protein